MSRTVPYVAPPVDYRAQPTPSSFALTPLSIPPTQAQVDCLRAIRNLIRDRGQSPTLREIAAELGRRSVRTITEHVFSLRRKGLLDFVPGQARSCVVTATGFTALRD